MGSTWISSGADGILGKLPTKVWGKKQPDHFQSTPGWSYFGISLIPVAGEDLVTQELKENKWNREIMS